MSEQTIKGFAGINNVVPAERVNSGWTRTDIPGAQPQPADLTAGVNVEIDDSFRLSLRFGTVNKVSGAKVTSLWSTNNIALMVQGGALKRLWPDMSTDTLLSSIGTDVCYREVEGRVYLSDNLSVAGVIDQGVYRSWGLPAPTVETVSRIQGNLAAGTYLVSLTYTRDDGQEGGASAPLPITVVENSGIHCEWTAPTDGTIDQANLYVSTTNGEILYRAAVAVADSTAVNFTGGLLAVPLNTLWLDPAPVCNQIVWHKGRIYVAQSEFIQVSNAFGYELFDLRDYLPVDGTRINVMESLDDGIVVGTEERVVFLKGDNLEDMKLDTVLDARVLPGSCIVEDGYTVLGVRSLAGKPVAVMTTSEGVIVVLPDGTYQPLTRDRYTFTTSTKGAALFRTTNTIHQYILMQQ